MEETLDSGLTARDKAELTKIIEQYREIMRLYDEKKVRDWKEIERLRLETDALLENLRKAA
jgi:hypothetical protein